MNDGVGDEQLAPNDSNASVDPPASSVFWSQEKLGGISVMDAS